MNTCRTSDVYSALGCILAEIFKKQVLKISLTRPGGVGLSSLLLRREAESGRSAVLGQPGLQREF